MFCFKENKKWYYLFLYCFGKMFAACRLYITVILSDYFLYSL
jgi:hypothetical protein